MNGAASQVAPPDGGGRPSDTRRKLLNEELSVPMVSNFFSIERYYDAADKVFESSQAAFTAKNLDNAYVYGKRYCMFCLDAIPTHNYFTADRYKHLQLKHRPQVDLVLSQLSQVAELMDVEELQKQLIAAEKAQKEAEEKARRDREAHDELMKRASQFTHTSSSSTGAPSSQENLQASALSKLDMLRTTMSQEQVGTKRVQRQTGKNEAELTIKRDPSGEEPSLPSSRYRLLSDSEDDDGEEKKSSHSVMPPPIPPPSTGASAAPPSYNQAIATQRGGQFLKRNFLAPLGPPPAPGQTSSTHLVPSVQEPKAKRRERLPVRKLKEEYRSDYIRWSGDGRIEVSTVDTYQGRKSSSLNGCTVISALVAARHLSTGGAIADTSIVDVIDRQCGPLLQKIRGKLGLGPSALIIPSDVHDHLVDAKILHQEAFEGAAGGSVMDPNHMNEFLKLLDVGADGKGPHRKAAATFFFHEHVISIVKIPATSHNGTAFFDLVDSLPTSIGGRSKATRTRCHGIQSLAVLLRYYTSRKFSESNCSYIDRNDWDDAMADFDPRVFQGFVWSNRGKQ